MLESILSKAEPNTLNKTYFTIAINTIYHFFNNCVNRKEDLQNMVLLICKDLFLLILLTPICCDLYF